MKKKIIILHHHLLPGGVTDIISAQINALGKYSDLELGLAVGNSAGKSFPGVELMVVPELDYLSGDEDTAYQVISKFFLTRPLDEIFHCHNPTLGKNPALTRVLYEEVYRGRKIFYHCHDFAEDRPQNYQRLRQYFSGGDWKTLPSVLYPDSEHCRFGVINRHDAERLAGYGVDPGRIEYLPNPVAEPEPMPSAETTAELRRELGIEPEQQLWLYPVRAIPRKNIGEFIFLIALFRSRVVGAITLPPNNPVDFPAYEQWRQFVTQRRLPILFAVGEARRLSAMFAAADLCLTTSSREGFGMAFVQPWLYRVPVAGRLLPMLAGDFEAAGMDLSECYLRLFLPEERRDFVELPPEEQRAWIVRISESEDVAARVLDLNPGVAGWINHGHGAVTERNIMMIRSNFSMNEYGRKLYAAYQRLVG